VKHNVLLTIMSLLSILLSAFHIADDIARGIEPATLSNYAGVLILFVWLYGTLMLAERRAGYVIMILGSLLGAGMPIIHMMGRRYAEIAQSSGGFFFVCTLFTLGVTSLFSLILSVRGLWSLRRNPAR